MANTGAVLPQSVTTAAESPWLDNDWVNPTNIYGAGEAEVSAATYDAGDQTYVLKAYNFNFSAIPAGSSIQGVIAVVTARYATVTVSIDLLQLLDTSLGKVGTNLCATPQALTTTSSPYTFGTSTNTWGNALTAAWVKNSNFGIAIGCLAGGSGNSNNDVFIDSVTLNVYYTAPTAASDNQPAYMSVRGVITDNQPSYTKGKTTTSDNQPAYLEGTPVSVADIQTNEGHLRFSGIGNSYARALAKSVATSDEEVLLKFKFNETSSGGTFRVFIRASNNWNDWQTPTTAYEVAISNTGNWIVNRITTGSRTQIGSTVTWTSSTNYYWLRFYANSTTIKAKVWQDGGSEPTWDLNVNDTGGFTTAGNLQLGYFRTAGSKEMVVDSVDLHASTAGISSSDTQPAYLKGRATLTDNQISYTKGKDTSTDNQISYLFGLGIITDNQSIYLKGTATLTDNQTAYIQGKSTSIDNQPVYLQGRASIVDNQTAYVQGKSTLSDNQIVYTQGKDSLTDNQPSYIKVATFPFTENFPEANGQPWNPNSWETYTTLAGYIDVNGNTGRMGGETGVEKAVALVPRTTEAQEVVFRFPQTSNAYRTAYVAIVARDYPNHTDHAYPQDGYAIEVVKGAITITVKLVKIKNGTKTDIQQIPNISGDLTFRFKYEPIDGTTAALKVKVWSSSIQEYTGWRATDPASWVFTVERFTAGGGLIIGNTWSGAGSGYSNFDNIDYHIPSLESKFQFAYTKGRATATDNQFVYTRGKSTSTDNQPSYLIGVAGLTDNQPAYLVGKDTLSDNQIAYLNGVIPSVSDNQPCYIVGKSTLLDNQPAYLSGKSTSVDNQAVYLSGKATISDNQPAFIGVYGDVLGQLPAYLKGKSTLTDNQISYLRGSNSATDNQICYLAGGGIVTDSQPCYLNATGNTVVDNQPVFLKGNAVITDNQFVYLRGNSSLTDNQIAYLNGRAIVTDTQPVYLIGKATATDNQPVYLIGGINVTDNQTSYLEGRSLTTDNQPVYIRGKSSLSDNQFAYVSGREGTIDNLPVYLTGQAIIIDNQPAYAKGGIILTDSTPAFLFGGVLVTNNIPCFLQSFSTGAPKIRFNAKFDVIETLTGKQVTRVALGGKSKRRETLDGET